MKLFVALALVALVGASFIEGRALPDAKSVLIARGNDLLKKAQEVVTKLEAEKRTHEATIIKTEEAKIQKIIADLEAATDSAKMAHLDAELMLAEVRLQLELLKAGHSHATTKATIVKRGLKLTLVNLSKELLKKAQVAVTKLEAENKKHEVTLVKTEEAKINKIVAELEATADGPAHAAKLSQLEHELLLAEVRLESHLQRIEHNHARTTHAHHTHVTHPHTTHAHVSHHHTTHAPHVPTTVSPAHPTTKAHGKRDVKADLIAKSTELLTKAEEAIKTLTADHKTHHVASLKAEEKRIQHLVADLQAATDDSKIKHIEHELARAETRLAHHLEAHGEHHHAHSTTVASF